MSLPFLRASDLTVAYGDNIVFSGLDLTASAGQRLGLVGENGVGKSTLLRVLARAEQPQHGHVDGGEDIGFLRQELPFPAMARFRDVLDDALAEIRATSARLDQLTEAIAERTDDVAALDEYGRLLDWAQAHDLWDADRRAKLVCAGLGLSGVDDDRPVGSLSGGQRSRLALAALLIRQPETLLLDEPTNHLDDEAMTFLQRHLTSLSGVVMLSSHDRVFLEAVCTDIVDLDPALGGPTRYGGTYSDYMAHKRAERGRWQQRFTEEQAELRRLRHDVAVTARAINHNRPARDSAKMAYDFKAGRVQRQISRRVRGAQQRLAELGRTQVRKPPPPLRFAGALTRPPGEQRLALSLCDVDVPGRLRLGELNVSTSARLLVTGGNGAGKSTLLAVLAGQLAPARGTVHRARGVRVGLLAQDVEFADPARTPRELYDAVAGPDAPDVVSLGLLLPKDVDRPVGALSVGQRRRVGLALLLGEPPDVLLLDEPTNHISLTLAEELSDALDDAPGAVVVASHDRWLRQRWDGEHLALD